MFKSNRDFLLSIVLRTQLNRLDCLEDALLSLSGQSDQNFELIVVLHSGVGLEELVAQIVKQPEWFRKQIKILQTVGGQRGVPLNAGITASNGTHISFFDDDDLLTSTWVEEFHRASDVNPTNILRSQVGTLWNQSVTDALGREHVVQIEEPIAEYTSNFLHIDHLSVSHTPFMSLCFPAELFKEQGLSVDEDLVVCEDWDLLLRATSLAEIVDIPDVTSFYRRWVGQETSYSKHSLQEWKESETKVLEKISSGRLVLPGRELYRIRDLLDLEKESHSLRQAAQEKRLMEQSFSWKITSPLRSIRAFFISNAKERQ